MSHSAFIEKFIERLGKIDPQRIEKYLSGLAEELSMFEAIFENMPEGILVVNDTKRIMFANHNARRFLGAMDMNEGKRLEDILPEASIHSVVDDALRGGVTIFQGELTVLYPVQRVLAVNIFPLAGSHKNRTGVVLILADMTSKKIEQETSARSERIDSLTLLAGGVAHELGNPLNSIGIRLQLIEREVKTLPLKKKAKINEHLGILREEIERLHAIIQSFLIAVRPIHGEFTECDIHQVIGDSLKILGPELERSHIKIIQKYDVTLPLFLMIKGEIIQALINILKNAMEAIGSRGHISIITSIKDQRIIVKISDSGSGIAPDKISKIFAPYYTTKTKGSGLGLMIVQRIIQQHGGHVEVESQPSRGTTFSLIFPLRKKEKKFLITSGVKSKA